MEYKGAHGTVQFDWMLSGVGKGGRTRDVPVPCELVDELGDELARHGFERQVSAPGNRGIHLMGRFDTGFVTGLERPAPWSASGLYQAIKAFLAHAADSLPEADAQQLKKASTHWLRHCIPHPTIYAEPLGAQRSRDHLAVFGD